MPKQVPFSRMRKRSQNRLLRNKFLNDSLENETCEVESADQASRSDELDACSSSKRFFAINDSQCSGNIGENLEYDEFSNEVQFNSSFTSGTVDENYHDTVLTSDEHVDLTNEKTAILNESIEYIKSATDSFLLEDDDDADECCDNDSAIDLDEYYECETIEDNIVLDDLPKDGGQPKAPEAGTGEFSYEKFKENLAAWAIFNIVTATHVDTLLDLLRTVPGLESLPHTSKTLKKTPFHTTKKEIKQLQDGGLYYHFGLEKCLQVLLPPVAEGVDEINLLLNADGVALAKSGGSEIWNILCTVQNIPCLKDEVMPVGFYHAPKKPKDAQFMEALVDELCRLVHDGIKVNGKTIKVYIQGFCCDAPARSLVLGTINFNGLKSCTRCHAQGQKSNNRTHFPTEIDPKLRTNDEYLDWSDKKFRKKETPVSRLPVHFVRAFSLDSMHLVFHGIMKTILALLFLVRKQKHKLGAKAKSEISAKILRMKGFVPVEFARKPRVLDFLSFAKATELRFWLLYSGPLLLKKHLTAQKYVNFLSLHVAMRILFNPKYAKNLQMISYAQSLIEYFVKSFSRLYGSHYITYNFHALLHLTEDLHFFGNLTDCSAFKFENYNMFIISLLKKKGYVLAQIANRLTERFNAGLLFKKRNLNTEPEFLGKKDGISNEVIAFEKVKFNNVTLSTSQPDDCCQLKDDSIVRVTDIHYDVSLDEYYLLGNYYLSKDCLYEEPCKSSLIDEYQVSNLSSTKKRFVLSDIVHKCVLLPKDEMQSIDMFAPLENESGNSQQEKSFLIAEFKGLKNKKNYTAIICSNWRLKKDNMSCYYPKTTDPGKRKKLTENFDLDNTWPIHRILRILAEDILSFQEANEKLILSENSSDLEKESATTKPGTSKGKNGSKEKEKSPPPLLPKPPGEEVQTNKKNNSTQHDGPKGSGGKVSSSDNSQRNAKKTFCDKSMQTDPDNQTRILRETLKTQKLVTEIRDEMKKRGETTATATNSTALPPSQKKYMIKRPLKEEDEFDQIEEELQTDANVDLIIDELKQTGEVELKPMIKAMLYKVCKDELLSKFSWKGRKSSNAKEAKRSFSGTRFSDAMLTAARDLTSVTDKQYKETVEKLLQQAPFNLDEYKELKKRRKLDKTGNNMDMDLSQTSINSSDSQPPAQPINSENEPPTVDTVSSPTTRKESQDETQFSPA